MGDGRITIGSEDIPFKDLREMIAWIRERDSRSADPMDVTTRPSDRRTTTQQLERKLQLEIQGARRRGGQDEEDMNAMFLTFSNHRDIYLRRRLTREEREEQESGERSFIHLHVYLILLGVG